MHRSSCPRTGVPLRERALASGPELREPAARYRNTSLSELPEVRDREKVSEIVRVLVVDDHPAFRKALASALRLVGDIEVAGEASGGEDACIGAKELQPDVVLMDLSMPDISGIEAMQRIHSATPELPVVILTAHADEGVERAARGAGASGFVAKGRGLQDILRTLHEVTAGS
jgi:DNA-binding NarL/FixJ family response regulator